MGKSDSLNTLLLTGMGPFALDENKTYNDLRGERARKVGGLCPKAMIAYTESPYVKRVNGHALQFYLRTDKQATLIMADPLAIG
jgi:hypothetical protein